jgi:hypothetical protein
MTTYIKLATKEYPRHEGDIRIEHPEITEDQTGDSFPCPDTYAKVNVTAMPPVDYGTQKIFLSAPYLNSDGLWQADWVVKTLTPADIVPPPQG